MVAVDNKCLLLGAFTVVMYFMWMDIALWYHLQALVPTQKGMLPKTPDGSFSLFYPVTVKMLMCDPINHYIYLPLCYVFTQVTHFTETFSFITPNVVSISRVFLILPGLRLLLSESLGCRQSGVAIILVGEWMDALDGFLARLRAANQAMTSEVGALGYYLDGICDGVSAVAILVVCMVQLKRHPPRQSGHPLQLPVICNKVESKMQESKESLLGGGPVGGPRVPVPARAITITMFLFGFQLLLASVGWNHAIAGYQQLLENGDGSHTAKQLAVLQAASTWILMWFWRVACFHMLMHCFLIAVFFDKLWEFLTNLRFIGYVALTALIVLNELHLQAIQSYF
ncbi:ceramide phosphoethanolamine synthase-like [Amphibalanus amphitrite]|uniref:ceramide phosphoethanolamine synthase-like n=1 Tax=Amphibalanus amphitrite TaxID=1232801 RepID=UPI001C91668B|nr:ceramide phosphoethanolamine synthase-like [Amphibalanus amphitrite]